MRDSLLDAPYQKRESGCTCRSFAVYLTCLLVIALVVFNVVYLLVLRKDVVRFLNLNLYSATRRNSHFSFADSQQDSNDSNEPTYLVNLKFAKGAVTTYYQQHYVADMWKIVTDYMVHVLRSSADRCELNVDVICVGLPVLLS